MATAKTILVLVVIATVVCFAQVDIHKKEHSRVIDITETNFENQMKNNKHILIMTYNDTCIPCKGYLGELEKATEILEKNNQTAKIGRINMKNKDNFGDEFGIISNPTFIWFVNQKPNVYSGGLLADDIYTWIKRKSDLPSELVTEDRLNALKSDEKILVVFYGDADSQEFKHYITASYSDDKSKYVHVVDAKAKLPEGLNRPGVVVFRKFDDPVKVFVGPITVQALEEFIKVLSVPRCVELILEYFEEIFEPNSPALFLLYDDKNADQNKTKDMFCSSAKAKKFANVKYVHTGITEGIQQNLAEYIGVGHKDLPALAILQNVVNQGLNKYIYTGDVSKLSKTDIDKFVADFKDGNLKKSFRSEPVPERNDGDIKTIVGDNFKDIVGKQDEVLVLFYVPWCKERMAPELAISAIAQDLQAKAPGLVFAKCNSAANEIEGVTISGYPLLKFFKKNSTVSEEYEGDIDITCQVQSVACQGVVLVVIIIAVCFAQDDTQQSKQSRVIDFTDTDFKAELSKYERVLVEFTTPWCELCKHLDSYLDEAAERLENFNYTAKIGKLDLSKHTNIGEEYEIKSQPSFIWFVNQKPNVYSGGLLADDIYTWIKRKSDLPSELVTEDRLNALKSDEKILVVFYGDADSQEFEHYITASYSDDKSKYVHVVDAEAKLPEGLKRPGVAVFRKFDDPVKVFVGPITVQALEEFIKVLSVPRCVELILEYFEEIFEPNSPALFLLYDDKNADQNKTKDMFCSSAKAKKFANVKYVYTGINEGIQQNLAEYIGVGHKDLPALAILQNVVNQGLNKYIYTGDVSKLSKTDIDKFVADFKDGNLKKSFRSEPVPERNDGDIKTIVGDNFKDIVGKQDEVLVLFYVPWCNECIDLEEGIRVMAQDLQAKAPGLVFAKCNSAANEIEGVTISGYPLLKFFKKNSTVSEEYEGYIDIAGIYKYLLTHSEAYKEYVNRNAESNKKEDL